MLLNLKKNSMKINKLTAVFTIVLITFSILLKVGAQEVNSTAKKSVEKVFESKVTVEELKNAPVKLIPYPQKVFWANESLAIEDLHIKVPKVISSLLYKEINQICIENQISLENNGDYDLSLLNNDKLPEEGYTLKVTKTGIFISASNETGFFYALQTLRQLIMKNHTSHKIQLCQIEDAPKFPIRGFMVDVGRNFQSISILEKQLDIMAKYKMNTFQWHLTDRPAWRIESKKYPELIAAKNHRPSRNPGE